MKNPVRKLIIILLSVVLAAAAAYTVLDVFAIQHVGKKPERWDTRPTKSAESKEEPTEASAETVSEESKAIADKATEAAGSAETEGITEIGTEGENPTDNESESGSKDVTESETEAPTVFRPEPEYHYADGDIQIDIRIDQFASTTDSGRAVTTTYYIADIIVSSPEQIRTALASYLDIDPEKNSHLVDNYTLPTSLVAEYRNAILAINGDGCGQKRKNQGGYCVRNYVCHNIDENGNIIRKAWTGREKAEDLIIYSDGEMGWIDEKTCSIYDLRDYTSSNGAGVRDVLSFGPVLIKDGEIAVGVKEEITDALCDPVNPRTAFGWVDGLHYVFLVADGRTSRDYGLSLYQCATLLQEYGCQIAYNLDGGGSSTIVFQGQVLKDDR